MSKINKIKVEDTTYDVEDSEVKSWARANEKPTYNYNEIQNTPDLSNFITKDVNNLTYYELKTNTANNIVLTINSDTYVMTLQLRNSNNEVLSTQTIDLPLETMVIGASYDSATKEIVLTLKNLTTVRFSVADLVSGLQTEITSSNKLDADLVDDTLSTNKFVSASDITNWNSKIGATDYATANKGGVIKLAEAYNVTIEQGGPLKGITNGYSTYETKSNNAFITKGTLENVITGKDLTTKAYVGGLVGDINTILATLTTPSNNGGN